ncbi:hypothetical protein GCM10011409_17710 [Lentibacillus populi]|uniref:TipAS antibiotic-recognition domain-containing protein n=1 Tax=Lentibacillus populi TaxID=1827502 RepID=A0A9W5TWS4_9BACI|nr:hypothetical protein GCM10011409_17710 [Lentibacillus populi]
MNEAALEAKHFQDAMAKSLREGLSVNDEKVEQLIREHLDFLNQHGHETKAIDFVAQTRFFLHDDFHLNMLENQQTGLAYYLCIAAEAFAS